jgi:hypothetical protein
MNHIITVPVYPIPGALDTLDITFLIEVLLE